MLHKEIPFLRIGLPLCVGIITGLYFKPDTIFLVSIVIIITFGFTLSLFFNGSGTNQIFGYPLSILFFSIGIILYTKEKENISVLKSEETLFACTLSDYPAEKMNSYMLTVKLNRILTPNGEVPVRGSMLIYNMKDSVKTPLIPGDQLIVRCSPLEIVNKNNPYEFDYKFYAENQGIKYYAFTRAGDIVRHIVPEKRKLVHKALIIREKIIDMYRQRGISGERLALVAAITLGQKNMLDQEQKQNFIKAGVMHIMAVSGLHAVILSLFVFNLLFFLKRRFNILRIIITILILWSFAYVTGLTPSVLRATLMFSFLQAGYLMKRPVNSINSVLASAFVLILIKPSVIFDAGFLLSYSAVLYIICFYFDFYQKFLFKNWLADKIWQSAVVTIVAQAGTLPLTIMLFNRFPTYFMLSNIIIVPLSNLLIIVGCILPLSFPVVFLSRFLGFLLNNLTGLTEMLTAWAAALPWSTIENIGLTTIECVLLSATLFLFSFFLLKKKSISIYFPVWIMILFILSGTVVKIVTRTTSELIVYNTPGTTTIGIRSGKILNLYSDTTVAGLEVKRHCAALRLKVKISVPAKKTYCLKAGEKTILISNSLNRAMIQNFKPDIIILTGIRPEIEKNLNFSQFAGTLVISSEAGSGFRLPQQIDFSQLDTLHLTRKSGAFIKSI